MKTYTGTVVCVAHDEQSPRVTVQTQPSGRAPLNVTMHCGSRIAAEAAAMIGRKVQFQVELSERTACLTDLQLCVRSEYGLRAVREDTKASGVREIPEAAFGISAGRFKPSPW